MLYEVFRDGMLPPGEEMKRNEVAGPVLIRAAASQRSACYFLLHIIFLSCS